LNTQYEELVNLKPTAQSCTNMGRKDNNKDDIEFPIPSPEDERSRKFVRVSLELPVELHKHVVELSIKLQKSKSETIRWALGEVIDKAIKRAIISKDPKK
jgi:hypothetical protein